MKKLVIQTQYLENYGSRESVDMRFKGGSAYVYITSKELDQNDIANIVAQFKPTLSDLETTNGGCEEYILSVDLVPLSEKVCEDWQSPIEFSFDGSTINFIKINDNREDGWMRKEILEQIETWSFVPGQGNGSRNNYKATYLMEDGDIVTHNGLAKWLDLNVPAKSQLATNVQF